LDAHAENARASANARAWQVQAAAPGLAYTHTHHGGEQHHKVIEEAVVLYEIVAHRILVDVAPRQRIWRGRGSEATMGNSANPRTCPDCAALHCP